MKSRAVTLVLASLILAACQTTAELVAAINTTWIGRPVEQLFLRAGPPIASFDLSNGGAIYTWASTPDIRVEPQTTLAITFGTPAPQPSIALGIEAEVRQCRARILTDRAGRIVSIDYEPDSTISICARAFGTPA